MREVTLDDLRRILIACAGEGEEPQDDDIRDTPFVDLGYDSLALIEAAARLKQEFSVVIPDDLIRTLGTPRAVLEVANSSATDLPDDRDAHIR